MSFWVLVGLFVLITACVIFITSIRKSSEEYREVEAENDDPPFVDRRKSLEELSKEQEQFVNTLETAPKPQQPVFVSDNHSHVDVHCVLTRNPAPRPSNFNSSPVPRARRTDDRPFRQSDFSPSHHHHHDDDFVEDVAAMVVADLVVDAVESFIEPERDYSPEPERDYSPEPSYEAPSYSQDYSNSCDDRSDSGSYDSSDNGCSDD